MEKNIKTVEEYLGLFPKETQSILEKIRSIIHKNAPEAIESISYGMPAYKTFKKPLVYFAAYKNHIGFYATPSGHTEFTEELANYKQGKGSVQFPLDRPIPYWLIEQIVLFKIKENQQKFEK